LRDKTTRQVGAVVAPPARPVREKSRMFPAFDQPSKKPCLFQPAFPSSHVEWYRPPSGWFNVIAEPPPRPAKRGRDSVEDLTASMKRLRTDSDDEEAKEAEKIQQTETKEPMSTALVVTRPTTRCRLLKSLRSPDPDYSLPPPMGSFPVVLYKGPPSPTVGPRRRPPSRDMEELSLSRENRTLRVSPSMTIELVDDDEEEPLPSPGAMTDEPLASPQSVASPRTGPTMTDDD